MQLPGLPDSHGKTDVSIRRGEISRTCSHTSAGEDLALVKHVGKFLIRSGSEITVDTCPDADPALVRVMVTGRVMAFLLRQRGWLPLHASAVAVSGKRVLFLAPSGTGKSTTAAAFYMRGHPVLTDDLAPVRVRGGISELQTSHPMLKLLEDSASLFHTLHLKADFQLDKHCFNLPFSDRPTVTGVDRIYSLAVADEIKMEPVPPLEALRTLSENTFATRQQAEPDVVASHLRRCAEIAASVPVRRLVRPRALTALPELVRLVETDLAAAGN